MSILKEYFLNILFPRRCVSCQKLNTYLCEICKKKIEYIPPFCPICQRLSIDGATHPKCKTVRGLDGLYVLTSYKGPMKSAIKLLKYRYVSDVTETLTSLLAEHFPAYIPTIEFFIPIPLSPKRERLRGFNQTLLLAVSLGKKLNIPICKNVLMRIKETPPQAELKRDQRKENVKGVFICVNKPIVKNKSIAVIDDVSTTGATLFEAAKILKLAGARSVWGVVLSHGN